jgi:hypothetical protein
MRSANIVAPMAPMQTFMVMTAIGSAPAVKNHTTVLNTIMPSEQAYPASSRTKKGISIPNSHTGHCVLARKSHENFLKVTLLQLKHPAPFLVAEAKGNKKMVKEKKMDNAYCITKFSCFQRYNFFT